MSELIGRTVNDFLAETASSSPAPGGGSVSALVGALSAALAAMVSRLTAGEKFADVETEMHTVAEQADSLRAELSVCVQRDTDSFNEYMAALRMPKTDEAAATARRAAMQEGLKSAARVPLHTAQTACSLFPLIQAVVARGNPNARSDGLVAAMLARAAVLGAALNVRINLGSIRDEAFCAQIASETDACVRRAVEGERAILHSASLAEDFIG